jgi:hypothetical protein
VTKGDIRLGIDFELNISVAACEIAQRRIGIRSISHMVSLLWRGLDNPTVIPEGDIPGRNLMRSLRRKWCETSSLFLPEIDNYIWGFLEGELTHTIYRDETVFLLHDGIPNSEMDYMLRNWSPCLSEDFRAQLIAPVYGNVY